MCNLQVTMYTGNQCPTQSRSCRILNFHFHNPAIMHALGISLQQRNPNGEIDMKATDIQRYKCGKLNIQEKLWVN